MAKKITSHNQSGGITAEKVKIENNVNTPEINTERPTVTKKKNGFIKSNCAFSCNCDYSIWNHSFVAISRIGWKP